MVAGIIFDRDFNLAQALRSFAQSSDDFIHINRLIDFIGSAGHVNSYANLDPYDLSRLIFLLRKLNHSMQAHTVAETIFCAIKLSICHDLFMYQDHQQATWYTQVKSDEIFDDLIKKIGTQEQSFLTNIKSYLVKSNLKYAQDWHHRLESLHSMFDSDDFHPPALHHVLSDAQIYPLIAKLNLHPTEDQHTIEDITAILKFPLHHAEINMYQAVGRIQGFLHLQDIKNKRAESCITDTISHKNNKPCDRKKNNTQCASDEDLISLDSDSDGMVSLNSSSDDEEFVVGQTPEHSDSSSQGHDDIDDSDARTDHIDIIINESSDKTWTFIKNKCQYYFQQLNNWYLLMGNHDLDIGDQLADILSNLVNKRPLTDQQSRYTQDMLDHQSIEHRSYLHILLTRMDACQWKDASEVINMLSLDYQFKPIFNQHDQHITDLNIVFKAAFCDFLDHIFVKKLNNLRTFDVTQVKSILTVATYMVTRSQQVLNVGKQDLFEACLLIALFSPIEGFSEVNAVKRDFFGFKYAGYDQSLSLAWDQYERHANAYLSSLSHHDDDGGLEWLGRESQQVEMAWAYLHSVITLSGYYRLWAMSQRIGHYRSMIQHHAHQHQETQVDWIGLLLHEKVVDAFSFSSMPMINPETIDAFAVDYPTYLAARHAHRLLTQRDIPSHIVEYTNCKQVDEYDDDRDTSFLPQSSPMPSNTGYRLEHAKRYGVGDVFRILPFKIRQLRPASMIDYTPYIFGIMSICLLATTLSVGVSYGFGHTLIWGVSCLVSTVFLLFTQSILNFKKNNAGIGIKQCWEYYRSQWFSVDRSQWIQDHPLTMTMLFAGEFVSLLFGLGVLTHGSISVGWIVFSIVALSYTSMCFLRRTHRIDIDHASRSLQMQRTQYRALKGVNDEVHAAHFSGQFITKWVGQPSNPDAQQLHRMQEAMSVEQSKYAQGRSFAGLTQA